MQLEPCYRYFLSCEGVRLSPYDYDYCAVRERFRQLVESGVSGFCITMQEYHFSSFAVLGETIAHRSE